MTIPNVSSVTGTDPSVYQNSFRQKFQDFKALASALRSGDLSGAQNAFAALQKDLQNGSQTSSNSQASQLFGNNGQANSDFQALASALQSGDISTAQQAFANLKQDLHGASQTHRGHHHRRAETENDGDGDDGAQGSTSTPTAASSTTQTVGSTINTQA